ncbi:MAG: hypothetical protein ISR58_13325 [Anaerolineales bacterium]|nr:hypothetical protein [Chloroflexota bacterium]MBL6982158.1 hypothetical protein [Anaerolineales bacterium]
MNKKYYLLAIISTLLFASLACAALSGNAPNEESASLPANVLFQDDFSDTSSGWDQVSVTEGITDYKDGHYRILVNTDDTDIWANPGLHFTDVVVEVDATKAGGPDDNDFGIICRYQDVENFYFFIISSDGFYGIGKYDNGEWVLLNEEQMLPTEDVNQGNATNHIRADCVGTHFVLYANNIKLAEIEDSSFASGDIGLLAGTLTEVGVEIQFDNLVVKKP